jgi:hypothetical protein
MLMKSIVTENARTRQVAKPNHGNACCNQFTDKKRMMRTDAVEDEDAGDCGVSIVIPSLIGESSLFRSAYWVGSSEVEKKAYILRLLQIALESDNDL